jgi:hypothetical protein
LLDVLADGSHDPRGGAALMASELARQAQRG